MTNERVIAPCGVDCGGCEAYLKECNGCTSLEGKPSWLPYIEKEVCPLYECPVTEHQYETCAECPELPCQKFKDLRDPSMTDEQFEQGIQERLRVLKSL